MFESWARCNYFWEVQTYFKQDCDPFINQKQTRCWFWAGVSAGPSCEHFKNRFGFRGHENHRRVTSCRHSWSFQFPSTVGNKYVLVERALLLALAYLRWHPNTTVAWLVKIVQIFFLESEHWLKMAVISSFSWYLLMITLPPAPDAERFFGSRPAECWCHLGNSFPE